MSLSQRATASLVKSMPTNVSDRDILREKWRLAAVAFEKADDLAQRAKEDKAIFFDALVETLMDQAEKRGDKLPQGKAERMARTSPAYKAEVDKAFDLRLTARLLAIEEKNADREFWQQISLESQQRAEMRMSR
ncbi:MAG: hypothetical protein C4523_10595 [Myxococcales bacterium]|nr:MAG: hypothetical protein C4523_10595 [Myxococcales bacterium]